MSIIKKMLCLIEFHDWRYASVYRRSVEIRMSLFGRVTEHQISRARCQRCDARKWELDQ